MHNKPVDPVGGVYPLFPVTLEKRLERIYAYEIAPALREKQKELRHHGERLFNLQDTIEERIRTWVERFLLWHARKILRIKKVTNLAITDTVGNEVINNFVELNVGLIRDLKQVAEQTDFTKVMTRLLRRGGEVSPITLTREIINETGVTQAKGEFWARDQVSKLNADIDREKYAKSGIEHYIWLASLDGRTRSSHRSYHGTLRRIGEGVQPGEEYNCRCTYKPATQTEIMNNGLDKAYIARTQKRWEEADRREERRRAA